MPPKREGRALPPDTPPERHGVITLNVKVQGAKLTVDLAHMGELTLEGIALALEFKARQARQQVGAEAAKAELLPMVERLQRQAEGVETPAEAPVLPLPGAQPSRRKAKA